jgi:hypothetical protein
MSHVYTPAKTALLNGDFDYNADDIRLILVMTNTTADTEQDDANVGDIGTLDEFDGSGYTSGYGNRVQLANEAINEDAPNDRAEFDADNVTLSSLGAGTRDIAGLVIYRHTGSTADSDAKLIAYIDSGGFPFGPNGGDLTINWNAEGILQVT